MAQFLIQISYTSDAIAALVQNPQDRSNAIRPAVEKLGGTVDQAWFAFGDFDVALIASFPDSTSALAFAAAVMGGGAVRTVKTVPLVGLGEGLEAFRRAAACGYQPPKRTTQAAG